MIGFVIVAQVEVSPDESEKRLFDEFLSELSFNFIFFFRSFWLLREF